MLHALPLPTPFPVGPVNAYLAEGEPLTLIDTGPKDDATRAALAAALKVHGHRLEDIRRIILTHHHVDHVGLAGQDDARNRRLQHGVAKQDARHFERFAGVVGRENVIAGADCGC